MYAKLVKRKEEIRFHITYADPGNPKFTFASYVETKKKWGSEYFKNCEACGMPYKDDDMMYLFGTLEGGSILGCKECAEKYDTKHTKCDGIDPNEDNFEPKVLSNKEVFAILDKALKYNQIDASDEIVYAIRVLNNSYQDVVNENEQLMLSIERMRKQF